MKFFVPVLGLLLAASCPTPPPNPEPTTTPTPVSTPTPIPVPILCYFPQGVPEQDYKLVGNPGQFSQVVDQTIRENTTCSGETDCNWGIADPQVYLATMIKALQAKGLCAGQHENGSSDQISVSANCNANVTWENYQPVNFGGTDHKARFAPGNVKDGWQVPVACVGIPNPDPTPTPKPTPTPWQPPCGTDPLPPCQAPIDCPKSLDKLNLKVRDQAAWIINCTPKTCDREFCARVFPGNLCCDMGLEGSNQREICEAKFGPYQWNFKGVNCPTDDCFNVDGNQLLQKVRKSAGPGPIYILAPNGVKGEAVIP